MIFFCSACPRLPGGVESDHLSLTGELEQRCLFFFFPQKHVCYLGLDESHWSRVFHRLERQIVTGACVYAAQAFRPWAVSCNLPRIDAEMFDRGPSLWPGCALSSFREPDLGAENWHILLSLAMTGGFDIILCIIWAVISQIEHSKIGCSSF